MTLESIFKAYDIRGKSPGALDASAAEAIGAAFGFVVAEPVAAVGRDCRRSSPALAEAFIKGLVGVGVDAWDAGETTTDMVYYIAGSEGVAGAMITASHNPPDWNGIKLCRAGAIPVGAETGLDDVRAAAESGVEPAAAPGSVTKRNFAGAFIDHLLAIVGTDGLAPLTVVADAGNGMAGLVLEDIFARIGPQLDGLYLEPDGTFPNHPADPLRPENLEDLIERMSDIGANLGVAFDGDADRAFFVDDRLDPLSGSAATAIIARWFLQREPGATVVHNLITSRAVPEAIEAAGGTAVRTRVGHSFIKQVMAETGAVFGGEHSGHYYFRDNYRADSGLLAMLSLLRVLSEDGRPLSELRREFEAYRQSGEINLEVTDDVDVLDRVAAAFEGRQDRLDGLTVAWPDRWFNLRPSNTEPVLRLNVEADDDRAVTDLVAAVTSAVGAR